MYVITRLIFASKHEIKKAGDTDIYLLLVRKTALFAGVFAFSERVIDAWLASKIMGKPALVSLWTVVLII